jgi:hypothetical protein
MSEVGQERPIDDVRVESAFNPKAGMMRTMLYEAAQAMMRSKKWSWLKAWAMQDLLHHHQHPSSSFGGDAAGNADLPDRASYD